MHSFSSLTSVAWLQEHLGDAQLKLIDASWHLPAPVDSPQRDAYGEYLVGHIPGAVFFDIDACSTPSDLPHMLPNAVQIAAYMSDLGIRQDDHIVIYDSLGLFSAARLWWTLRMFGCEKLAILDGGLPAWNALGLPLANGQSNSVTSNFQAQVPKLPPANSKDVLRGLNDAQVSVLDARPKGRFLGIDPEVRPGLRSGHMPGAINIPTTSVLNDNKLLPVTKLQEIFAEHLQRREVITSCGSGVTAAVLLFALHLCGYEQVRLYDGSWAEWGANDALPCVKHN